jgi:hypothetical protein
MATAENGALYYEGGQVPSSGFELLTNSGDNLTFSSLADIFSKKSGYTVDLRPNGILTGGAVSVAASGSNDVVDGAALTCWLAGVKTTVGADADLAITRGVLTDTHMINSITIDSSGAYAVVTGTDSTAFVETRGAAGGPPFIPVGSIEVAQVRTTSVTAAPITAAEIFAVPGTHREEALYPVVTINHAEGTVTASSALPLSHTGGVTKRIYASYNEPQFIELTNVTDFVAPEDSVSVTSTQIYQGTLGATTKSVKAGGFTAYLDNGVADAFLAQEGEKLWFKFLPDAAGDDYVLCNGTVGMNVSYPAGANINAKVVIAAENKRTLVSV